MSTTPTTTEPYPTTETQPTSTPERRQWTGAPALFSPTNRQELPSAFGDEAWASGEP